MLGHGRSSHLDTAHLSPPHCFFPPRASPHAAHSLAPCSRPSRAPPTPLAPRTRPSRVPLAPLAPCSGRTPPTPSRSAHGLPGRAKGRCWWWLCSRATRSHPDDRNRPTPPYVVNVCFKYFRCLRGMLQLFYMDVAKADRDVAHVASVSEVCCKSLFVQNII